MVFKLALALLASGIASADYQQYIDMAREFGKDLKGNMEIWGGKAMVLLEENAPPEVKILAREHLPGIFKTSIVCSRLENGAPVKSHFPGETLTGTAGKPVNFACTDGTEFHLDENSSLKISGSEQGPVFELTNGGAGFSFSSIRLRTPGMQGNLRSLVPRSRIRVTSFPGNFGLLCLEGKVEGDIPGTEGADPMQSYLGSNGCFISLKTREGGPVSFLFHGDVIHPSELDLPRARRSPLSLGTVFPLVNTLQGENKSDILIQLARAPNGAISLRWQALFDSEAACVLQTQWEEGKAPAKAFEFKASQTGSISLHPDYLKNWISLVCRTARRTFASQVLAPVPAPR